MKLNHKELQDMADRLKDYVCKKYGLEDIKIRVKDIRRGRARIRTRYISIPKWSYENHNIHFFMAYILHELAHIICRDFLLGINHNEGFKKVETDLLKDFKMKPEYKRAYIKEIWDLKEEKLLWIEKKNLYELVNK